MFNSFSGLKTAKFVRKQIDPLNFWVNVRLKVPNSAFFQIHLTQNLTLILVYKQILSETCG